MATAESSSVIKILLHPFQIFFASTAVFTLATAYTRQGSPLRYGALAVTAACAYTFPWALNSYAHSTGMVARVASGAVFWNIVSCLDKLILRRWDYYHYGPVTELDSPESASAVPQRRDEKARHFPGTRMDFASEVTGSARAIGLWWQVKNVPPFSEMQPTFVPTRLVFIFAQSVLMVFTFYLHNASARMAINLPQHYQTRAHMPLITRMSEVSFEELRVRTLCTLGFWVTQFCMMQFVYALFAILSTISKPHDVKLWRPQFGSISDAYSVRLFWGKFWHQNLRSGLEGVSDHVAHGILQLPRRGLLQRYTKVLCSFLLSGAMHVVSDMGGGLRAAESGALIFFPMQAAGIIVEDLVQDTYRRYFKRSSGASAGHFERIVGYIWVLAFLIWTSPVWIFQIQTNLRPEDALLSFDVFKPILFGRSV